jgi:hypothetical protein
MSESSPPPVNDAASARVRRPYTAPVLTVLGSVGELTSAVMGTTGSDGATGMWTRTH